MNIEIGATAVSWYAAIVATVSAVVSIYNAWRDRAHIRFRLAPNLQSMDQEDNKATRYLVVTVVNCGRRPITVSHLVMMPSRRGYGAFIYRDSIEPTELTEGKFKDYLLDQSKDSLENVRFVEIQDASGRKYRYRVPRSVRRALESPPQKTTPKKGRA